MTNPKKILHIPGLNLHPYQMQLFAEQLPYQSEVLTLPGINPHQKDQKVGGFEHWVEYVEKKINSGHYDAFVGFSLGGLLLATLIKRQKIHSIPIIMIAPALRIFHHSWLPEKLLKWTPLSSMLSLQKSQFIVHRFTPKEVYLAFYEGLKKLGPDLSFLEEQHLLCFLHNRDELVWSHKIRTELERLNQNQMKVKVIDYRPVLGPHLHHLCFHPDNLTNNDFRDFSDTLTKFLDT